MPSEPLEIEGAPDLIVQLLDKLIDNAVDFSPAGGTITVRFAARAGGPPFLEVDNPGPPLAPEARGRLFESLWQSRSGSDSRPHFGLGLYIVRLIAEHHRGGVAATDLPGGEGARFGVRLPLADTSLFQLQRQSQARIGMISGERAAGDAYTPILAEDNEAEIRRSTRARVMAAATFCSGCQERSKAWIDAQA